MATHRIPILGAGIDPDASGEVAFEAAHTNFGANDLVRNRVLGFGSSLVAQPTIKHGVYGSFVVPKQYVSSATIIVSYAVTLIAGQIVWDFDYRSIADGESFDPATWQESATFDFATVPGTARLQQINVMNLTSANFAVDDTVLFYFARDGASANDTLAGRAYLFGLYFQYSDV